MTVRRARALVATIVLGTALAGCGVTTQDQPTTVDPRDVPFELLQESPSTTTTTSVTARPAQPAAANP